MTLSHPPPATVPFLEAYLGNPPESNSEFYKSVCAFVADIVYTSGESSKIECKRTVRFAEPLVSTLGKMQVEDEKEEVEEYECNSPMEDFQMNLARLMEKWAPFQLPQVEREYLSQHNKSWTFISLSNEATVISRFNTVF